MIQKKNIMEVLKELCIPANIKGYRYLLYGIEICMADNYLLDNVTKELYPAIAKLFNVTANGVERSIRHAIELSYQRTDTMIFEKYFGKHNKKTTNSEFIATLVFILQYEGQ